MPWPLIIALLLIALFSLWALSAPEEPLPPISRRAIERAVERERER